MHVQILGSGSGGNSAILRAGETHVLIDAGLPIDDMEKRLEEARIPVSKLDHIVLTHGHLDHARSAGLLARKSRARVHCAEGMMKNASVRAARTFSTLPIGGSRELTDDRGLDPVLLTTVPVPHDAHPTVALRLEAGGRVFVLITDMGRPDDHVVRMMKGAHVLSLEFNHDAELLRTGPYPRNLKRRVSGDRGHLSNAQAAKMLRGLASPALHTVLLAHLSRNNNTKELACEAATQALLETECEAVQLLACEQDTIGPNLRV